MDILALPTTLKYYKHDSPLQLSNLQNNNSESEPEAVASPFSLGALLSHPSVLHKLQVGYFS